MPLADDVNRVWRDFERYTGDGKPNAPSGKPLPIGDERSGIHHPGKGEIRNLLLAMLQAAGDPSALQAIIDSLNGKADIANSGKMFPSRASAVAAGQDVLRPAISQIITREDDTLAVRSASATADDPLFDTYPQWGVVFRAASRAVLNAVEQTANGAVQRTPTVVTNWDTISLSGNYRAAAGAANAPTSGEAYTVDAIVDGNVGSAVAVGMTTRLSFARGRSGGTWGPWTRLMTSRDLIRTGVIQLTGVSVRDRKSVV